MPSFTKPSCFLLAVAGCFHVISLGQSYAAPPDELRVLCYNIHYGQGNDGQYDLERLARVIREARPDLVALQEVDVCVKRSGEVHQARELAKLTGLSVRYGPTQNYQGGLYGNAVLTNLPIDDVHIQPLPDTESTPELTTYPRGAIAVKVRWNGQSLRFVSTHFQHNLESDRIDQAKAINEYFGQDEMPTILAGDMNATPESEPIQILETVWRNAIDDEASPTAPSHEPRSRIDYIFFRGEEFALKNSKVIQEPMASDHRPVMAVFQWQPE